MVTPMDTEATIPSCHLLVVCDL